MKPAGGPVPATPVQPADYRDSHRGSAKAHAYDREFSEPGSAKMIAWHSERRVLALALRRLPATGAGAVDFACGTGRVLAYLRQRVPCCTGIDVSPEMLAVARTRCPGAALQCADVTRGAHPEIGHPVHLVTAFRFFLNADAELRQRALDWIRDQLAPGGLLVASFHLNPHSVRGRYLRTWRRTSDPMLSLKQSRQLLRSGGFEVVSSYGYEFLPYRRDGASLVLPRVRCGIEGALNRVQTLTPVAGAFVIIARVAKATDGSVAFAAQRRDGPEPVQTSTTMGISIGRRR